MSGQKTELKVAEPQAGQRLDQLLSELLGSRAQAQNAIKADRVRVNGEARPKRYIVEAGEVVTVMPPASANAPGPEPEAPLLVAYEDEHLLIVDKPAGVVVHPARGHPTGTLAQALAGRAAGGEEPWRAGIVHRLDRDTSGLLVVAKSEEVHRRLKSLLATRRLSREYVALVDGHPSARRGTIEAPIGRDRRDRLKVSIDTDHPRPARTHFEVERVLPEATLLRVSLDTGRTHQIRVHLAAIGHPVCGDPLYGRAEAYGLERQFLHAHRLSFPHPSTNAPVDVSSPLPADLEAALELASE